MKTLLSTIFASFLCLLGGVAHGQTWQLVWSDEFTNGISPDWVFETGTGSGGWGNNELQYYRRENATVSNGQLVITARRENYGGMQYTSARMKTQGRRSFKYGRIEARIAMPSFQGVWPAFWMLGDNITTVGWPACGEIDIMEHVNTGGNIHGTIHWSDNNGNYASYGGNTSTTITNFHVYAIEWTPASIKWFLDGVQFHEVNIQNGINGTHEFHNNHFLLLNMAIGGNWPGFTVDNNAFPASMYVDYVRVYQQSATPTGVASVFQHCNYGGTSASLPVGDYTLSQLTARGMRNDDISSLRVSSGYELVAYQHDNFSGAYQIFTADDACLVDNGINDWISSLRVRARSSSFSQTIQAESYSSMYGVQLENTTDAGGGQNVGWIDAGDWMAYNNISIPSSGSYTIEYRVASPSGGQLSLDLNGGATVLGSVNVPATGGWQTWTTVSQTVNINAGTYNFGIYAARGGWNINWWRITRNASARIAQPETTPEAETATTISSVGFYPNPTSKDLNLSAAEDFKGGQYQIYNTAGQKVMEGAFNQNILDVSPLKPGLYVLKLAKDGQSSSHRFVKE